MKKALIIILILFTAMISLAPIKAYAVTTNSGVHYSLKDNNADMKCNTLLGNPEDSNSVAWLLDKVLGYIQVVGPILVIILSSIDFAKVVINSDDDAMAKAQKKLIIRLALAASLFILPALVKVLLATFGLTSDPTCGIG